LAYFGNLLSSGSEDGSIEIWDIDKDIYVKKLHEHYHPISFLCFFNENILVSADYKSLRIWNTKSGENTMLVKTDLDSIRYLHLI
jgi:WD40 repeat protein